MTKQEKAQQLKLQLESLTGRKVQLVKEEVTLKELNELVSVFDEVDDIIDSAVKQIRTATKKYEPFFQSVKYGLSDNVTKVKKAASDLRDEHDKIHNRILDLKRKAK